MKIILQFQLRSDEKDKDFDAEKRLQEFKWVKSSLLYGMQMGRKKQHE